MCWLSPVFDAAIVTIQSMLTTPGPYTKSVVIPEQVDSCGYIIYGGHDFKDKEKDRQQVREAMNMFVEELVIRLSLLFLTQRHFVHLKVLTILIVS